MNKLWHKRKEVIYFCSWSLIVCQFTSSHYKEAVSKNKALGLPEMQTSPLWQARSEQGGEGAWEINVEC